MKRFKYCISCLFVLAQMTSLSLASECSEDSKWQRSSDLNSHGRVFIYWNYTNEDLTMLMIGQTKGWVGIGFSPSGSMAGADLVLGWVKEGNPYLQDRYATKNGRPSIDDIQSYDLINGYENETHTLLCWTRKLNNCDKQDFSITNDTIRIIWALNPMDPVDLSYKAPAYHGSNRGVKSIDLLHRVHPQPKIDDMETTDFVARNITIPKTQGDTLYWCSHFTLPKAPTPTHLIGMKPVISESNTDIVHHWLLYECPEDLVKKMSWTIPKNGYNCFNVATFPFQNLCINIIIGWAIGESNEVYFPHHLGYPFHSTDRDKYFMLQTHYDTKFLKEDRKDNSGVRLLYTKALRKYEIGLFGVGINVSPFQLIPPGQREFTNLGVCSHECTQQTFPKEGVRVFSVMFHSHLAGRKIRLRIFRDGIEQPPLFNDNYDFNFQNDTLVSECVYDTTHRNYTTIGDFGTDQEMCLIFILHYPASDLSVCGSYLQPTDVFKLTGVESIWPLPKMCSGSNCPSPFAIQGLPSLYATVKKPKQFNGMKLTKYLYQSNWTQENIDTLQKMYYQKEQNRLCKNKEYPFLSSDKDRVRFPAEAKFFESRDVCEA